MNRILIYSVHNNKYGPVAQLEEQLTHNLQVPGSGPGGPTNPIPWGFYLFLL